MLRVSNYRNPSPSASFILCLKICYNILPFQIYILIKYVAINKEFKTCRFLYATNILFDFFRLMKNYHMENNNENNLSFDESHFHYCFVNGLNLVLCDIIE